MVFYLQESPGSEESRWLSAVWRAGTRRSTQAAGVGVLQLHTVRTTLPAGEQQDTALQAPSRVCNYI